MNKLMSGLVVLSGASLAVIVDASLKGMLLLALACVVVLLMRRASAANRHQVWLLAVVSLLLLPVLSGVLPGWRVLPQWVGPGLPVTPRPSVSVAAPLHPDPEELPAIRVSPGQAENSNSPDSRSNTPWQGEPAEAAVPEALPPAQSIGGKTIRWGPIVMGVWLAGLMVALVPVGLGASSLWRIRRRTCPVTDGCWLKRIEVLSNEIGLRRPVSLLLSSERVMPMVWGLLRPKLLMPAEAEKWPEDRLRMVLLHELAHVKRWDCLTNALTRLVCALYWFNPLVWVLAWRMRVERERACDDIVLRTGANAPDYADELLQLTSGLKTSMWVPGNALAMARKSTLEGRLLAIVDKGRNRLGLTRVALCVGLALVAMTVVPMAMLQGQHDGRGGSFAWHSLSGNFACETRPGQAERVLYLVFCEDHPLERKFMAGVGGTIKLSNGAVVQLSFAKDGQFWVDPAGKVTVLTEPFTAEQVNRLADLSVSLPGEDIKSLQDVRALLSGNGGVSNPVESIQGKPGTAVFGPVIERVVTEQASKATTYLDLDTGKHMAPDPDAITVPIAWLRRHGVDLDTSGLESERTLRTAVDMVISQYTKDAWNESAGWTPEQAREFIVGNLARHKPSPANVLGTPGTYAFRTREGGIGIMQLLPPLKGEPEVTVRYKLLKEASLAVFPLGSVFVIDPGEGGIPMATDDKVAWGKPVEGAPVAPAARPLWIALAPRREAVGSIKELEVLAKAGNLNQHAGKAGEWELRGADNGMRIARIAYNWPISADQFLPDGEGITGGTQRSGRFTLEASQLRLMPELADGNYLLAWYVAGRRCSNVMPFRIDKAFDTKKEPLLKLMEIEPAPGRALPALLLRASRHAQTDPAPWAHEVAHATLNLDGQDRALGVLKWTGPDAQLRVGGHYVYLLGLDGYTHDPVRGSTLPPIDPGKPHVIFAKVGGRESNRITLNAAAPLGAAWDAAIPKIGPAPKVHVLLSGAVFADGKPAPGYEVSVVAADDVTKTFRTTTDAHGRYEVHSNELSCPAAEVFSVSANPPAKGQPEIVIRQVELSPGMTAQVALSLEKIFTIGGRVTYPDGTPAANVNVMSSWPSPDGKGEFNDSATTGPDGRYSIGSPFPAASFVGWGGSQVKHDVKAGRTDVDFVADPPKGATPPP